MGGAALAVACYAVGTQVGGATGAAVGSVVVYGTLSAVAWAFLQRRLRFPQPDGPRALPERDRPTPPRGLVPAVTDERGV